MNRVISLGEFIIERQKDFPYATGELSRLISAIRLAAKIVNREVNKAGLVDILGIEGSINVQGEEQQKLDVYANNQFISALKARGEVCGIGSEENEDFITFKEDGSGLLHNGKYVVLIDPLDGSSNIDVNVSIGTVFSIYRKATDDKNAVLEDFLQSGVHQVAAGYIIYGSSTMLVYTTGNGVNGFTYDPSIGVFCLSHPNMKIPETGPYYSVNEGNFSSFSDGIKKYIEYCKEEDLATSRPLSSRYIGSLVSDFHRNLIKGGIYLYPGTQKNPEGKLRLLYECNPLAFIIEKAGGKASDGFQKIITKKPKELHERTPLIIGSTKMVDMVEEFIKKYG